MSSGAPIMQTILKAINFTTASLRAKLHPVYDMGIHAVAAPNFPWMILFLFSVSYLLVIFSEHTRHVRNEATNQALRTCHQQLASQINQANATRASQSSIDDNDDEASSIYSTSEDAAPHVTVHKTFLNFTAPMKNVHFHSWGQTADAAREALLPTMAGHGTRRLLEMDDDCEDEMEDEMEEEGEEEECSGDEESGDNEE